MSQNCFWQLIKAIINIEVKPIKKIKYTLSIVALLLISCSNSETYDLAPNGKVAEETVEVVEAKELKPYMLEEGYDLISSDFRDKKEFERKETLRIEKEKILAEEKRQEEIRLAEEAQKAEELAQAEAARVEAARVEANKVAENTQNNQQSGSSSEQKAASSQKTNAVATAPKPAAPAPKQAPVAQPAQPTSAQGQLVVRGQSFYPKSIQDRWAIQSVIDAGHVSYTNFNGTKMFFGHNPGVFGGITGLSVGDIISYSGRNYRVADKSTDTFERMDSGATRLGGMSLFDVAMNGAAGDAIYLQFCEGQYMTGFLAYPI